MRNILLILSIFICANNTSANSDIDWERVKIMKNAGITGAAGGAILAITGKLGGFGSQTIIREPMKVEHFPQMAFDPIRPNFDKDQLAGLFENFKRDGREAISLEARYEHYKGQFEPQTSEKPETPNRDNGVRKYKRTLVVSKIKDTKTLSNEVASWVMREWQPRPNEQNGASMMLIIRSVELPIKKLSSAGKFALRWGKAFLVTGVGFAVCAASLELFHKK